MTDHRETKAFEILARENSRMLTMYLRSLVDDEAAVDDLFQEAMVVAWRRLDECDLSRPFGPWLRGIASRLVMAYYRKRKRLPITMNETLLSLVDQRIDAIDAQPGDSWDEKLVALRECVDALPVQYHDAVQMRYLHDQSTQGVAQQLKITIETCKKRLQRGRRIIADCLRRKGVLVSGGIA